MRKFNTVFKEKQDESIKIHEERVLGEFKSVYSKMLDIYNINSLESLDESNKKAFTTQINEMWNEENGITEKGKVFLNDNCLFLTESSTKNQKKNYLKQKSSLLLKESFRQYDLKYKIYDIIDSMYEQVKAGDLSGVLKPNDIIEIISESFNEVSGEFLNRIKKELKDSVTK